MLCKNNGIFIFLFHCFTEIFPKLMIKFRCKSQICCHIKAPAINIIWGLNPFFCNT